MRCEAIQEFLDAYRTGELNRVTRSNVERHLASCSSCEDHLEYLKRLAFRTPLLRVAAPAELLETVRDRAEDRYGCVQTEIGKAWVAYNSRGITMIHLGLKDGATFEEIFRLRIGRRARPGDLPQAYANFVREAASGGDTSRAPLDLSGLAPFEREVLLHLRRIPRGEVRPYAWLAHRAGKPRAARAVGNAMARNPIPLILPCHRVVPTGGGVGNYGFGSEVKRALLEREGVPVGELDRLAREGIRFIGCKSTHIYCLPTCRAARRMRAENRIPFGSTVQAIRAGYRACHHCSPL